jgi:uncharacterized membrane protein YedE/YeeE
MPWMPEKGNARQRATLRKILIAAGIFDFFLAIFFLALGAELLQVEPYIVWIIGGGLIFGGLTIIVVAITAFGPKRGERAADEPKDEPIVRR